MTQWNNIGRILKLTTILGGLFLLISLDVVTPSRAANEWGAAPTEKQQINMNVPGMSNLKPEYWKRVWDFDPGLGVGYASKWRTIENYGVHALLKYYYLRSGISYYTIRDNVRLYLNPIKPSLIGDIKTYDAKLGEFEYIHFSVVAGSQKRKCVGFSRLFPGRKKVIYGHYCRSDENDVDENIIGPLIDSIDLDFQGNGQ